MKKLILLFFTAFTFINVTSQNFQWAKQIGGTEYEYVKAHTLDSHGNIYVYGRVLAGVDLDPGPGTYTLSAPSSTAITYFVSKLNPAGNFLWAKQIERGYDIICDANNNIIVSGDFVGVIDFDPGVNTFTLSSSGSSIADGYLLKLDENGLFIWVKQFKGTCLTAPRSISVDKSGNIYSAGTFSLTTDFDPSLATYTIASNGSDDIFISKLDAAGNFLWAKSVGGIDQEFYPTLSLDSLANVYISGLFKATVDFDPGIGVNNISALGASQSGFVLKLNTLGNYQWVKVIGSTSAGIAKSVITADRNGNSYISGLAGDNSVDFDPGPGTYTLATSGLSMFIWKLSSAGNFVWAKGINNAIPQKIALDKNNNVYLTGSYELTTDFDPGVGTFSLNFVGGNIGSGPGDVFILKLNDLGNFVWAKQISSPNNDTGRDIKVDENENVYVTGEYSGVADFNPGTGTYTQTTNGFIDVFILKLTNCLITASSNANNICAGNTITLTGSGATTYTWNPMNVQGNSITTTPATNTTYTLSGSVIGCTNIPTSILSVSVNPLPTIITNNTPSIICIGSSANISATGANTYTWYPGNQTTSVIVVSPTVSTSYTVTGSNSFGCKNNSVITQSVLSCAGLNNISYITIAYIFPNPSSDKFTFSGLVGENTIEVYDVSGRLILNEHTTTDSYQINLNAYNSGIYFYKLKDKYNNTQQGKLLLQ